MAHSQSLPPECLRLQNLLLGFYPAFPTPQCSQPQWWELTASLLISTESVTEPSRHPQTQGTHYHHALLVFLWLQIVSLGFKRHSQTPKGQHRRFSWPLKNQLHWACSSAWGSWSSSSTASPFISTGQFLTGCIVLLFLECWIIGITKYWTLKLCVSFYSPCQKQHEKGKIYFGSQFQGPV